MNCNIFPGTYPILSTKPSVPLDPQILLAKCNPRKTTNVLKLEERYQKKYEKYTPR